MKINNFYTYTVIGLMLVFPVLSIFVETLVGYDVPLILLIGKWFVFWAIGVRLFSAGIKQAINPVFTLEKIFNIQNKDSAVVVRELGFANICMGTLGILSIFFAQFRIAAAITGGLYFGLAGFLHVFKKLANRNELIALASDIFIFLIMSTFVIYFFVQTKTY